MEKVTRREWLAGLAMTKMIELFPSRQPEDVAKTSLIYADAMEKALTSKEVKK